MVDVRAKIVANDEKAPDFFKIVFEAPEIAKKAKPGQFTMVRCSDKTDPLLRRPLSFHKITKTGFELLYEVVGKGTEILSKKKKGETLSVLGPLGNGFNVTSQDASFLVAGGMGIAPLLELARQLKKNTSKLAVFIGAKTKGHIVCAEDFKNLDAEIHVSTEDGSMGYKGLITDLLSEKIKSNANCPAIYACGPKAMLKSVSEIAKSCKTPCQVSLEARMACGTGACLGCAVETKNGFKMACKDGPVFNGEDIKW